MLRFCCSELYLWVVLSTTKTLQLRLGVGEEFWGRLTSAFPICTSLMRLV